MADVLFTHSYFLRFDQKEFKAMMPYPPLGTLYAASYARQHGFTVAFADSMLAESEEHIVPLLKHHQPKVFVIYDDDFNYLTKMCLSRMREASFRMSKFAKDRGCTVIVHGSDPVDHLEKYFANGADYVICGEGEETLVETLGLLLSRDRALETIDGLAYCENGRVKQNAHRRVRQNLDELPFPAWDLVDIEMYRTTWRQRHGYFSVNIGTTRGCPYHCNWCAKPIYGQVYNSRSPENVVAEMKFLKTTVRPDHLWICDDIFGLRPGWVQRFSEEVNRNDAVIPFKCLSRADLLLKEHAITNIARAGCQTIWIGAESGSQKILDAMDKGTTVEQIYEATRLMQRTGIRVGFFLQYGYPSELQEDIDLTLKMLKDCMPDEIGISVSYPLPGTRFYENVKSQLGVKQNWVESADLDLMYRGTYPPDFYRTLHKITHKRFRLWQSVALLKRNALKPWSTTPRELRRIASGAYHLLTLPVLEREMKALSVWSNPSHANV